MRVIYVLALAISIQFPTLAKASAILTVASEQAKIFSEPKLSARVLGQVKKGKKANAVGKPVNGFYRIKSKSGKELWIQVVDVSSSRDLTDDLFEVPDNKRVNEAEPDSKNNKAQRQGPMFTWDLGFSSGSAGDVNYSEANLGLNYFWKPWLAWRNAAFYRLIDIEGVDNFYGLDSMARLYQTFSFAELAGVTLFGGPGYRFVNEGENVPFAEAGAILRIAGLSLGGGFKTFFTEFVEDGAPNDTQVFIVLSGSGAF